MGPDLQQRSVAEFNHAPRILRFDDALVEKQALIDRYPLGSFGTDLAFNIAHHHCRPAYMNKTGRLGKSRR